MSPRTANSAVTVHPLLAGRWSPRSFDATHTLTDETARPPPVSGVPWRRPSPPGAGAIRSPSAPEPGLPVFAPCPFDHRFRIPWECM
ncbi:hypothetical protein GCM10010358_52360 [Streptomyces minutiscleroticus]|uniref:Uncharacterized protein n=1 Tax=Streptomyces minutiscleroticus TaxID=68238 RepID=A0A918NSS4_9ACTN|nr:hypothetical protein GCM10010358_52360 [Streptomyces minutiscleroticus]